MTDPALVPLAASAIALALVGLRVLARIWRRRQLFEENPELEEDAPFVTRYYRAYPLLGRQ